MKQKLFFLVLPCFFATHLFAQVKAVKPLTQKAVVPTPAANSVEGSKNNPLNNPPGDLQKAIINIVVGDDGKDSATRVGILLYDGNEKLAAYYGDDQGYVGTSGGTYSAGQNVTLSTSLVASEFQRDPRDETKFTIRVSAFSDFNPRGSAASLRLSIYTPYHEVWKIKSLSLSLYFDDDKHSPHVMTWNNIAFTNAEHAKQLKFDNQFNAIQ